MRVAFYKGRRKGWAGLFDAAVRWWTHGPYSHTEIVFSDGTAASSSFRDGGVRFKAIVFEPARWDFVTVEADEHAARQWFRVHLGARYDVAGLFGFVWRRSRGADRRWFCSESTAAALGLRDPWRFDPNTLFAALSR